MVKNQHRLINKLSKRKCAAQHACSHIDGNAEVSAALLAHIGPKIRPFLKEPPGSGRFQRHGGCKTANGGNRRKPPAARRQRPQLLNKAHGKNGPGRADGVTPA